MTLEHVRRVRRLYKTIMKLHRGLPEGLKALGNDYAREEFKRHKKCTTRELDVFMEEWSKYALTLAEQLGLHGPKPIDLLGKPLDKEQLDSMTDHQIQQLYDLMLAAQGQDVPNKIPDR